MAEGAAFAGELGAAFCAGIGAGVGAGVCEEARLTRSNELHRNRMRVKLDARMRRAPKKILYQEALRTGEENSRGVFSEQRGGKRRLELRRKGIP